jgi:plastocyanin
MDGSDMGGYSFNPNVITVNVGDTVNWTDVAGSHTTTSDTGQAESWDSQTMMVGQSYLHTFNTPGNYTYYSKLDGGMSGKVIVQTAVPEFPGLFVFVTVGLAVCIALALERALRRSP